PPPPGLGAWPRPGEAYVSPALLDALNGIAARDRYGRIVATIGRSGLADPGEMIAYIAPAVEPRTPTDDWLAVSAFGIPPAGLAVTVGAFAAGAASRRVRLPPKATAWARRGFALGVYACLLGAVYHQVAGRYVFAIGAVVAIAALPAAVSRASASVDARREL